MQVRKQAFERRAQAGVVFADRGQTLRAMLGRQLHQRMKLRAQFAEALRRHVLDRHAITPVRLWLFLAHTRIRAAG